MIIYFSGTGNSFSIAKKLGIRLEESVVPLKAAKNDESDRLIFVFPTYCYDIPPNVREFIKQFPLFPHQEVMGISVSGGGNGNSEYTFHKLMKEKGKKVKAFKNVVMTDNSFPVILNKSVEYKCVDTDQIVEELLSTDYVNSSKYNPFYKAGEMAFFGTLGRRFLKKKVDVNQCIGCGICSSICPNDNIKMVQKKAVIADNCTECFGCVHACPKQAIYIRKGITKRSQYRNKEISLSELNQIEY